MKAYERLLKYAAYNTTSEESENVPSTEHQFDLAKVLVEDMKEVGLQNVELTEHCYVYGTLPANDAGEHKHIGFIAHMDTSNSVSGENVKPRIIHYEGGDITLSEGIVTAEKDYPFLKNFVGHDLIITDGTTLLGADDKAGISEILEMVEYLVSHPEVKHGEVSVCFSPDEEVGNGTACFSIPRFGAEYAYTVDGGFLGELEYECFNAVSCMLKVNGVNVHPGSSKNIMKNAVLLAAEYISMLPPAETPAHTEGYEGFYHVCGIEGDETCTQVAMILRDHSAIKIAERKRMVQAIADFLNQKYGEGTFELQVKDGYRNMREKIEPFMFIVDKAKAAMEAVGVTPIVQPIRGGTDGANLSFQGLPCPNLCTGGANFHGVHEFASVQDMEKTVEILIEIVKNA